MKTILQLACSTLLFLALTCSDSEAQIREKLDPLIGEYCLHCHDSSTDTRLNFEGLSDVLGKPDNFRIWEKIYDRIQKNEMPPNGESRPPARLKARSLGELETVLAATSKLQQSKNGRVILRRLTRLEFEYTLHDLLKIKTPLAAIIPAENASTGFDTIFNSQGISPLHIESYLKATDTALEDALEFGRKPSNKKHKIEFTEHPGILKHLRSKNDKQKIVKLLDDAAVIFGNASYIYKLPGFRPEESAVYRFRVNAQPFQSQEPVILAIHAGDYKKGSTRILKFFDLEPGKDSVVEFDAHVYRHEYLFPAPHHLKVQPDGKSIWNRGPDKYTGQGVAIKWIEIEGPIVKNWPPPSTENLLRGVSISRLKKPQWRDGKFIEYRVDAKADSKSQVSKIIRLFIPRAFRRTVSEQELEPFEQLAFAALDKNRSLTEAVRVAVRAVLSSPEFLFMMPKPGKLDEYSLASRLSYFLWKSMPDNELLRLARDGKLSNSRTLRQQVERMLQDEKAKRFIKDFAGQWLQLYEIDATSPDRKLYPEFDDLLKHSMLTETESFLFGLVEEDLSTSNLVDSKFAYLNRTLAEHYGIKGVKGQDFRKVKLPGDSPRGGIITHASVLKITANGTTTSPVRRGTWVLTHLLGTPPSPPPPNVGSVEPDTRGATTIREILDKHRSDTVCATCHNSIDPPGFALESFDVIGGFRDSYRSLGKGKSPKTRLWGRNIWEYKIGPPVDSSGKAPSGESFQNINQFKQLLAKQNKQVARNFIENLVVYSTGAEIQFADRKVVENILSKASKSDFGVRSIIHLIVQSSLFQNK